MVADVMEQLIEKLGEILGVEELHIDANNTCLMKLRSGVKIQVEVDPENRFVIIGTNLGNIGAGKYREDMLRQALIANGLGYPRNGILSYSRQASCIVMFERIPVKEATATEIADLIPAFDAKATVWQEALQGETIPDIVIPGQAPQSGGMFGLTP